MGPRYLAILGELDQQAVAMLRRATARDGDLVCRLDQPAFLVFADRAGPVTRTQDGAGFVLGHVFPRHPGTGAEAHAGSCATVAFDRLIADYWGAYVALAFAGGVWRILRDPAGMLPCYYCRYRGATVVTSDLATLVKAGLLRPAIDWRAVADHLVAKEVRRPETCIAGLVELLQGTQLAVDGQRWTVSTCWSPWPFAGRKALIRDEREAAALLRDTILSCIATWAGRFDRMLLSLSGGLDSSIVAYGLARADADFSAFNLVTHDAVGDERTFARTMASAVERELVEVFRDESRVDLRRSHARHLPRPIARGFAQEMDRISADLAERSGASAYVGGGGGDSLFCFLQSAAPPADRLLVEGPGLGVLKTIRSMSIQADCAVPTVAFMALRRAWWRAPDFRIAPDTQYLSEQAVRAAAPIGHGWLTAPPGALPGKAAHIANLLTMQNHMEGFAREQSRPNLSPLMSQPLVELCLSIPTWIWSAGGRDRMAARRAFDGLLPRAIIDRKGKGTPGAFEIRVFERNRVLIREMLMDGMLQARGLLDVPAIGRTLDWSGPVRGTDHRRILTLVDIEAWLRSWA